MMIHAVWKEKRKQFNESFEFSSCLFIHQIFLNSLQNDFFVPNFDVKRNLSQYLWIGPFDSNDES